MTHIITIETDNDSYFEQIKRLAKKLGVITIEKHESETKGALSAQRFLELQMQYPPGNVSTDVDINGMIDESNL